MLSVIGECTVHNPGGKEQKDYENENVRPERFRQHVLCDALHIDIVARTVLPFRTV